MPFSQIYGSTINAGNITNAGHYRGLMDGTNAAGYAVAGLNDGTNAAAAATNGQSAAQLVAQISSTPVARATGDKNGNDITTTYSIIGANGNTNGNYLTNLNAASLVVGGTLPALDSNAVTNYAATNLTGRGVYLTNVVDGVNIDARAVTASFITNATMNIAGFANLVTGYRYTPSVCYSNSSASSITIGAPSGARLIGSVTSASLSVGAGKQAQFSFWIEPGIKTNMMNVVEP
jgi:hypothetical protein